ncbi:SpoIIE family protein phosphatase [Puerhibacterium puerhi]|uniref:SpoIIE family protein phosphatase n=1 Tax=Puerhibacterium puerhi TaxID=2692623 RepID=UPI00135C4337|nr:SpoIIE family protein phosphatase [Puerhibacterium puerhi]
MTAAWFVAATELSDVGREARDVAWDRTPLGAPETWSTALRHVVQLCFSTRFPVMLVWGPDLTLIYNDAYRDILGEVKHRAGALGAPAAEVWAELWDEVGPLFDHVLRTGEPTWTEDKVLYFNRSGFVEEGVFTFSYSPLLDDDGSIAGVLDISTETTQQVRAARRLAVLDELHVATGAHVESIQTLGTAVVKVLDASVDVARAAFYVKADHGFDLLAETAAATQPDVEHGLVGEAAHGGEPVVAGATVVTPLQGGRQGVVGALVLEASPRLPLGDEYLRFLSVVGATVASGLRSTLAQREVVAALRERANRLEREAARERATSLALQQAVLSTPPEPDHLQLAVRYQPAADDLKIGGDWYDAFVTRDGATVLVIGDVVGHDLYAAVTMSQIRGLVRALAYDHDGTPAEVLRRVDDAVQGLSLGVDALSTVIVARIEQVADERSVRTLRWSSAGHPPPVVVRADGEVEILWRRNDLPLGLGTERARTDHAVEIAVGDTFMLYTDGLVEQRRVGLQERLVELTHALAGAHERDLDHLADSVLGQMVPHAADDDIAMVAVRPSGAAPVTTLAPAPADDGVEAECRLAAELASVAQARHWVRARAAERGAPAAVLAAVEMATSELVTNAVRHAVSTRTIVLRFRGEGPAIRVEVCDRDTAGPQPRSGRAGLPGGHGLHIVDRVSRAWGWHATPGGGKVVWASFGW